ncbi:hypothetical protein AAFF_G00244340 [Aldrovandia affinis]|uniref:Integrase catalytic domain-containing protein n=1 Tax=Aldrovandia affinis TaxID=143900 RepID=A0AAD7RGE1_9TELE|nr:hypothetical protein AAFF_G00244340 [Aldrovandia affinis]
MPFGLCNMPATFELRHRPGRRHGNADALSWRPCAAAGCEHCPRQEAQAQLALTVATLRAVDGEASWLPLSPGQVQTRRLFMCGVGWQPENGRSGRTWPPLTPRRRRTTLSGVASRRGTLDLVVERIGVDILSPFAVTNSSNKSILVAMDYFTKWPEVYAVPDQSATTTAGRVVEEMWSVHSPPPRQRMRHLDSIPPHSTGVPGGDRRRTLRRQRAPPHLNDFVLDSGVAGDG